MGKQKIVISISLILLLVSIVANVYFLNQNTTLANQGASDATKVQMTTALSAVQVKIDSEIERVGNSIIYASQQLGTTGISGDQARQIIVALEANSSYIIEAATQNLDRQMIIVEPQAYRVNEGKTLGPQKWLNTNPLADITPAMTPVIMLITNQSGCSVVAPIFNSNKEMIGTVSAIFDPAKLLNYTVTTALAGTGYTMTVMQTDGLMVFDTDPLQLYKNMFTDPAYANYTQLLLLGHHVADYSSGYGSYRFTVDAASNIVVNKNCYWTTVYAYGQEWRLALQHSLI
jgi:hypothetical protein